MKTNEIKELSVEELKLQESNLNQELLNLRVQAVLGQVENPCRLRTMRRELARVKTILHEKNNAAGKGAQ